MDSRLKSIKKSAEEIDFSRIMDLFKRRWYVVLLTIILSMAGAYMYLRYSQPVYEAYATLKIVEPNAELRSYGVLRQMDNVTDNINSEMEILQSRRLVGDAVRIMPDIQVSYFTVGRVKTTEVYNRSPFQVLLDTTSDVPFGRVYEYRRIGEKKYQVVWSNGQQEYSSKEYYLGEPANENGFKFKIIERKGAMVLPWETAVTYQFRLNNYDAVESRALAGLKVEQMGYNGSMIKISCQDHVPGFTSDFINSLARVYMEFDTATKAQAANQALNFIEDQIDSLKETVNSSALAIEDFKVKKKVVTLESSMNEVSQNKLLWQTQLDQLEIQRRAIDSLEKNMKNTQVKQILSNTLSDVDDPLLMQMVTAFNGLHEERKKQESQFTARHPKVKELDDRIAEMRKSVIDNIATVRSNNHLKTQFYEEKMKGVNRQLDSIPGNERYFGNLEREFDVHSTVLKTLTERRIDAQINRRSIVSNVNLIDKAVVPAYPISPINRKVYMLAIGVGASLGIILLVALGLMRNTLSNKEEVESLSNTPVIGVVKRSSLSLQHKYPRLQIMENSKSSLSESVRSIRTNLQFISPGKKCKVVSITSTMSGEGKSFITINLAGIISMLNKKVVVLDLDLRKPKLHYSFGRDNSKGLSTYLVGKAGIDDILQHTEYEFLDIITSGPIPPNPAELIESAAMTELLARLQERYDYVMIDTPPVGLVTDGVSLLKQSDVSLYVVRADYSRRQYATIPDRLAEEQQINNLYIIINSVAQTGGKYTGYGYKIYSSGYYSDEEPQVPWWQFWKHIRLRKK